LLGLDFNRFLQGGAQAVKINDFMQPNRIGFAPLENY